MLEVDVQAIWGSAVVLCEERPEVALTAPHRAGPSEAKPRWALEDLCAMIEMTMCRLTETPARRMNARFGPFDAESEALLEGVAASFDSILARCDSIINKLDGLIHQCKITIWMMVAVLILELVILALLVFDPVLR